MHTLGLHPNTVVSSVICVFCTLVRVWDLSLKLHVSDRTPLRDATAIRVIMSFASARTTTTVCVVGAGARDDRRRPRVVAVRAASASSRDDDATRRRVNGEDHQRRRGFGGDASTTFATTSASAVDADGAPTTTRKRWTRGGRAPARGSGRRDDAEAGEEEEGGDRARFDSDGWTEDDDKAGSGGRATESAGASPRSAYRPRRGSSGMTRKQKYAVARGGVRGVGERKPSSASTSASGGEEEYDLRVTKSSHGALQRHVNAQKPREGHGGGHGGRGSGGRGGRASSSSSSSSSSSHADRGGRGNQHQQQMRPGERIVRAMESIEAPVDGADKIAWDVVGDAVNPSGGSFKFTTSTLNFAIKELGERGSFDRAYALYLWMSRKRGRFTPNEFTYVALAGAARTLSQTRTVQTLWSRAVQDKDEEMLCNEIASAVIAALNRVSDWSGAYRVFRDMGASSKRRNLYTYTAVLTALRDEGRADESLAVLNEMQGEPGVQPTSLAFALTLTSFDNARRWIEGNALAKRIKRYDVRPDTTLMHAIITMAGRAGDMAHANDVFNAMRNSTMIVSTYTFNALLGGYARYGDWDGCIEVYDEMKRSKLQPDSYTFTQLISAAERSGEYVAADGVWTEMLNKRIIPHTVMCGAYIHCLGCQGRDLEAEAVMEQMRDRWDVPRNAAVYNALIGAHVRSGEVTRALGVFEDMQSVDGLMPTEITFAVLIRACQESALTKRAAGLEDMRDALAAAGQLVQDLSGASTLA